jgi:hypothetical protein
MRASCALAWSPRAGRRGGALTDGPVVASRRQRLGLEHQLRGRCAKQRERRRGSPRRSGGGGVAGSG